MEIEKQKYQAVLITLADGRVGTFTGAVLVTKEDEGMSGIRDIKFTEPKELPEGCSLEILQK